MTQAKQTQNTDQNSLQRAVEDARQRAAKAEHELESMRHTVEQLQAAQSSQKNSRGETENIADERLAPEDALQHLRQDDMMAHLLDSLEAGKDIGHYGRLVFAMIARHFLSDEDVTQWLTKDRDFSADDAKAMLRQVEGRDYNPPRRERILTWQKEQEFPILPNADDPDCGNVYRSLKFPQQVYENIQDYQNEKAEASEHAA